MSKKDPRKLAKKRKAELQRRKERERGVVLPYHGWTYKTDEFTPLYHATESGIRDADLASQRTLVDWNVRRALEKMVLRIRQCTLLPNSEQRPVDVAEAEPDERVIEQVRRRWYVYFLGGGPYPGRDAMVGVLRTLLGSMETWTTHGSQSRGYLEFVEDFIERAGVRPLAHEILDAAEDDEWDEDGPDEEEPYPLKVATPDEIVLVAGRAWIREGHQGAREFFEELVSRLLAEGFRQEVAEACDELMQETTDPVIRERLNTWVAQSQAELS